MHDKQIILTFTYLYIASKGNQHTKYSEEQPSFHIKSILIKKTKTAINQTRTNSVGNLGCIQFQNIYQVNQLQKNSY